MAETTEERQVVVLGPEVARVHADPSEREKAIEVALRLTMSPHEWEWSQGEQESMARYVLWAHQRLSGIKQLTDGLLEHMPSDNPIRVGPSSDEWDGSLPTTVEEVRKAEKWLAENPIELPESLKKLPFHLLDDGSESSQ